LVLPLLDVYASYIPANYNTFFGAPAATIPVPLGAGTNLTLHEPHLPVTFTGTVCGLPILLPQ